MIIPQKGDIFEIGSWYLIVNNIISEYVYDEFGTIYSCDCYILTSSLQCFTKQYPLTNFEQYIGNIDDE